MTREGACYKIVYMSTDREIQLTSKAKINLGLDITGRRVNGYHDVRMVMQTLAIGDDIRVAVSDGSTADKGCRIALECPGSNLPCDERNLAYRAAKLLADEYELTGTIDIRIDKKIPVAAGLAGGSSDAAAVLTALNELCDLGLSQQQLMDLGLTIGADVPFCILQGTALAEGVGEKLVSLPALPPTDVLLVKPAIDVSTKWAYESWDALEQPDHPDIDALADAISRGRDLGQIAGLLGNTFEDLVFGRYPEVRRIKEDMIRMGAAGALMTGSGPTVFGLFEDKASLVRAADRIRQRWADTFIVCTKTVIDFQKR